MVSVVEGMVLVVIRFFEPGQLEGSKPDDIPHSKTAQGVHQAVGVARHAWRPCTEARRAKPQR